MKLACPKIFLRSALMLAVVAGAYSQTPPNSYRVVNLVSNVSGTAAVTDPNLVDPWGFSNPATPFWISDHASGLSTVYAATGVASATVVTIPTASGTGTGKPTGQVQNSAGAAFTLANGANASFIFDTEDGLIVGWNSGSAKLGEIKVNNSSQGAIYKGLAIGTSAAGGTLYAANFKSGQIDTYGPGFAPVKLAGSFADSSVPSGYAPFNIWNIGNNLYVAYAKQGSGVLDAPGPSNGYVAEFDLNGNLVAHLISGGVLNSPWGMAIAPANWGAFGGALLVGNFGDGTINAFNATTGATLGSLQDSTGKPLAIPGLWALIFGSGTKADGNTLYFAAGMPDGSTTPRGLLGSIAPPAQITAVVNAANWQNGPIAPGELIVIGGQTVGVIPLVATTIPTTGGIGTTLGNTTVTINSIPAPILYSSGSETSVQVPDSLILSSTANIVVMTPGQTSNTFSVAMSQAAPGLFAANASGAGALAAMNQDGSINTATNAATAGSAVTLYATGEGATTPTSVDGAIDSGTIDSPTLETSVTIGGQTATVVSAGTPVGELSGVIQVKVQVPSGLTPGPVPVVLTVGTATTSQNVTIGVK
jgi:uncharacterized protein (TIGR03118 family)